MKYCRHCILPDTRPHLTFDDGGVCIACRNHGTKKVIDWGLRERWLQSVVANAKNEKRAYDCVIPVSGGKDSTWQVVTCLQYGLHPLTVTWKTPARTSLGWKNLNNLISLGVDHIDYQVNPKVEKVFMRLSFEKHGTPMIPMHLALFNIPLRIAVTREIPLIIWGENSAFEYGGGEEESKGSELTVSWIRKYGATQGTSAEEWVSKVLSKEDLAPYVGPTEEELKAHRTRAIFLGYYLDWDPQKTYKIARANGFQADLRPRTGLYSYADIDDEFISIHHFMKWYKFGFTRLYDNLSIEIRNGRISRKAALARVRKMGDPTPHQDIKRFAQFTGLTVKRFFEIAERFRNLDVWERKKGKWRIMEPLE